MFDQAIIVYTLLTLGVSLILAGVVLSGGGVHSSEPPSGGALTVIYSTWVRSGALCVCAGFAIGGRSQYEAAAWGLASVAIASDWLLWRRGGSSSLRLAASRTSGVRGQREKSSTQRNKRATSQLIEQVNQAGRLAESVRPLWVAALLPLFVVGEGRYAAIASLLIAALWIFTGVTTGVWRRRSPASASLLILLLLLPVTVQVTPVPDLTREQIGYLLAELLTFYTVLTWAHTEERLRSMASGLVGVGAALALAAPFIMQQAGSTGGGAATGAMLRFLPDTIQKNVLGGTLAVLLPLCAGLALPALRGASSRARWVALVALALMLTALVYTQSRGALLALLAACLVMAGIHFRVVRWSLAALAASAGLAAWMLNLWPTLARFLQSDSVGDFGVRVEIWSRALQAIHDFPLTGVGLGAFRTAIPAFYPYVISDPEKVHHAHNLYLQIGAELGLPGLAAFLALVIALFAVGLQGRKLWERRGDNGLSWLTTGCIGSLCAMLAHGFLDAVTWGTRPAFVAWAVLGLLMASSLTARTTLHADNHPLQV